MVVEKLLLNSPVDGGNVLVRRSVENGVETLIAFSKLKNTSAAWMKVMAGRRARERSVAERLVAGSPSPIIAAVVIVVVVVVRTSLPTAMQVMLQVAAKGSTFSFTHVVAVSLLCAIVISSEFKTPTMSWMLVPWNACSTAGLVSKMRTCVIPCSFNNSTACVGVGRLSPSVP